MTRVLLCLLFLHSLIDFGLAIPGNNVCKSYIDYLHTYGNKNCWHDPDGDLRTPELIKKYAGDVETYEVTTEDGYILSVFRIPRKNPKGVLFFQHAMMTDSRSFMSQRNESTAFLMWKDGYDVWLGNQRGTTHSEKHVNLSLARDFKYWDFSIDETGLYDTPAMVNLIRSKTGSKVIYIGHSMGTTNGLVYASLRPEDAEKNIERFIFLSVSAFYVYGKSPLIRMGPLWPILNAVTRTLRIGHVLPLPGNFLNILRILFRVIPILPWISSKSCLIMFGGKRDESDPTLYNFDMVSNGRNLAWKILVHFQQFFLSKDKFRRFDYGPLKNMEKYGTLQAPSYPIWNVTVPVHLVASTYDELSTVKDAEYFHSKLNEKARTKHGFGLKISKLNHVDFILGKYRKTHFVDVVLDYLNKIR